MEKRLVIALTPSGRGQLVSHNLYTAEELDHLRMKIAAAGDGDEDGDASPSTPRVSLSSQLAAAQQEIAQLKAENERLRAELEKTGLTFLYSPPIVSSVMLNRLKALTLLSECTGDDIWSLAHCQERGIPAQWIEDLADCYESGYDRDSQTIYYRERMINQYEGIRDVDLAIKLGEYLGVNVSDLIDLSPSRARLVVAIRQAIEEE